MILVNIENLFHTRKFRRFGSSLFGVLWLNNTFYGKSVSRSE